MPKISKIFISSLILFFLLGSPLLADDFNPNFIISEQKLLNYNSMNVAEIQRFLDSKKGTLNSYITTSQGKDENGNEITPREITAAQAFYEIARRWGISPKFLLVLVQKEMSLITHPDPEAKRYDWATGYAVCDICPLTDPAIQRWKGFYKQINSAAAQVEYYLDNPQEFRYQAGQTYNIDGEVVTPENRATASMYNYTPHIHGNKNFYSIWQTWFSGEVEEIDYPYPDGSLLQAQGQPGVWYIQYGTRRPIESKMALITRFDARQIITVGQKEIDIYPVGWPINLANYSLVQSPRGQLYLIVDDEKRPIISNEVFKMIGWNPEEVEDVSEADLANFFQGDAIDKNSVYPQGTLGQNTSSGGVYFVKDGFKYPIFSKELMEINYPGRTMIKLTPEELTKYETREAVKFKDGTLIKPHEYPEVFVISNGKRRWIPDEETFISKGYKWENIIVTSYQAVKLHSLGEIIMP